MILLDTSVLIDPPNGWPHDELGASILALAELHFGIQAATTAPTRAERLRRLGVLRPLLDWLPFDERAAESFGILAAEVAGRRSARARSKDILMAAHAHSLGVPFMTRNGKDFELFDHLVEIIDVDR